MLKLALVQALSSASWSGSPFSYVLGCKPCCTGLHPGTYHENGRAQTMVLDLRDVQRSSTSKITYVFRPNDLMGVSEVLCHSALATRTSNSFPPLKSIMLLAGCRFLEVVVFVAELKPIPCFSAEHRRLKCSLTHTLTRKPLLEGAPSRRETRSACRLSGIPVVVGCRVSNVILCGSMARREAA